MNVCELTDGQLNELKWQYAIDHSDHDLSLDELDDSVAIPNEVIYDYYDDYDFTDDDFFCSSGLNWRF